MDTVEDAELGSAAGTGGGGGGGGPSTDARRGGGGGWDTGESGSALCSLSSSFFGSSGSSAVSPSSTSGTTSRFPFAAKETGREEFALFKVDGVPGADDVRLKLSEKPSPDSQAEELRRTEAVVFLRRIECTAGRLRLNYKYEIRAQNVNIQFSGV